MAFSDTLKAIAAEEDLVALTDEQYQGAWEQWSDIERRYAALREQLPSEDEDIPDKLARLVRRYGPKVAALYGGPVAGAIAAGVLADDGAFTSILAKLGSLFGGGL